MGSDLETAALNATANAFEQMGFLYVEPDAGESDDEPVPSATARVSFDGPIHGCVRLTVPEAILPELAANMLGQDDAPTASLQRDALGEMANVICGNVVPVLGGPGAVFRLGRPQHAEESPEVGERLTRLTLLLDGHPAALEVWATGRGETP